MIKKVLKYFFLVVVGIILLAVMAYYSFLGWEFITGGKYVDFLNENKETVNVNSSFSYEIMKDDIDKSKLILLGEIHGFNEPTKFDVDFFKHLYNNFGVRKYIAELDFAQAKLMNIYLETGEDSLLSFVLKNWVVMQGQNNKDYFDKYRAFHEYYKTLPDDEKFEFIGIDKVQDWKVTIDYLNRLSEGDSLMEPLVFNKETIFSEIRNRIDYLIENNSLSLDTKFELEHLLKNIGYKEDKVNREEVMYQNFYELYKEFNLQDSKLYGFFGLFHVFQYRINGKHPFASMVRQSDLGLEDKILSMNFNFVDSYMVTKSNALPEFMRDEGKYTRMMISSDNLLFFYIYGIRDLKRTTGENQKSLIKMNGKNSPYENSTRLNTTFQILPVTDIFEFTDKGKPYVQYMIFVRNSDWAEPFEN